MHLLRSPVVIAELHLYFSALVQSGRGNHV